MDKRKRERPAQVITSQFSSARALRRQAERAQVAPDDSDVLAESQPVASAGQREGTRQSFTE